MNKNWKWVKPPYSYATATFTSHIKLRNTFVFSLAILFEYARQNLDFTRQILQPSWTVESNDHVTWKKIISNSAKKFLAILDTFCGVLRNGTNISSETNYIAINCNGSAFLQYHMHTRSQKKKLKILRKQTSNCLHRYVFQKSPNECHMTRKFFLFRACSDSSFFYIVKCRTAVSGQTHHTL